MGKKGFFLTKKGLPLRAISAFSTKKYRKMKNLTLFVSYNPNIGDEQTLAIRIHTIGVANGLTMFLPDRFNSINELDANTKTRIASADYYLVFALSNKLSEAVKAEIQFASQHIDKSNIIVVYDDKKMQKLSLEAGISVVVCNLEEEDAEQISERLFKLVFEKRKIAIAAAQQKAIQEKQKTEIKQLEVENKNLKLFLAVMVFAVALFALMKISKSK